MRARYDEIDGIRGWAALLVVSFHLFSESLGVVFPQFRSSWFGFIFDGHFMVLVFFVLSGDALSVSFFKEGRTDGTVRLAIGRYFRLTFPVAVSCLLVYLLMCFKLTFNIEAGEIVHRQDWLGIFLNFEPNFFSFLKYSFGDVYFAHSLANSYNPFLWTMSIEMVGSLLLFMNIFIFNKIKESSRFITFQIIAFWLISPYFSLFMFGFLLGKFRQSGKLEIVRNWKFNWVFGALGVLLIVAISLIRGSDIMIFGYSLNSIVNFERLHVIWAMAFVLISYASRHFLGLFRSKFSKFLGEISFPIYVLQFPVIASVSSAGIVLVSNREMDQKFFLAIAGISLAVCTFLAWLFRQVERLYLGSLSRIISRILDPNTKGA